ncbi:MAG: hypothetical protein AB7O26_08295, partial [Planctomycetaceae bacterium]
PDNDSETSIELEADAPVMHLSNAVRLSVREWIFVGLTVAFVLIGMTVLWSKVEPFELPADYRIPFSSSEDYWLYRRFIQSSLQSDRVVLIGDSVIWGEYVAEDDSLSRYLSEQSESGEFVNGGVSGAHPLALQGLVRDYARELVGRPVILHFNPLWMSSRERDLQVDSEVQFNHPRLAPQVFPTIPAYHAPFNERLGNVIHRYSAYHDCMAHLSISRWGGQNLYNWSLEHPYENPFRKPTTEAEGLRHNQLSWTARGIRPQEFPWVEMETSLQWRAFRETVELVRSRGNKLFVIAGPLNEHLLTDASRARYRVLMGTIQDWLEQHDVPFVAPETLPSTDYADTSHPLPAGYRRLAAEIVEDEKFQQWQSAR